MKLIGMLDSPYVARSAISMDCLGVQFEQHSISVLREFEAFQAYNPVVKAPSLVCDNGQVLMESTLIIDYAECITTSGRSLMPTELSARQTAYRIIGLALVACEKTAQIYYERDLRPEDKQYQPWMERIEGQLISAMTALEDEFEASSPTLTDKTLMQTDITTAIAWRFCHMIVPNILTSNSYSKLAEHCEQSQQLPVFQRYLPG